MFSLKLSIISSILLICSELSAQTISNRILDSGKESAGQAHTESRLTMRLLQSATQIIYKFSNGSVAPEDAYQGYIIVSPNDLSFYITDSQSTITYNNTCGLSSKQYSNFIENLYKLEIKKNQDEPEILCGGGVYEIIVLNGEKIIFNGTENLDIAATKGNISDAFEPLLDTEMIEAYRNPPVSEYMPENFDDPFQDYLEPIDY